MDSLTGCGFVAIWNDVSRGADEDFAAWHAREHMPERLSLPGFLRGMRWGSPVARPRYFTLYLLSGPQVARSAAYLVRLNAPTPWTRRVMAQFQDNSRCVGSFTTSTGQLPAKAIIVARLGQQLTPDGQGALLETVAAIGGVAGCHFGMSDAAVSAFPTVERQGRAVAEPLGLLIVCLKEGGDRSAVANQIIAALPEDMANAASVLELELDMPAARDAV